LEAIKQLVVNAMEAMPQGGTLSVTTRKEIVKGVSYASVSIEDTGSGIVENKLDMIFEPFFTTKLRPKGTGLGLSIAKKVAEEHGGFIRAANREGKGAVFVLYFPVNR
jgi:signal transduction histidine kinase